MKKIVLLIAAFSVSMSAFSQVEWGVKAGLNLSNINGPEASVEYDELDADVKWKIRPDFYLGFFVEVPFSQTFSLQPEIVYSRQGATQKANWSYYGESESAKIKGIFSMINVPVLLKANLTDKFSLQFGPQVGFVVDAKEKIKAHDEDGSYSENNSLDSDDYNVVDFSLAMGLSYRFCEKFDVSARYNLGLTDVLDEIKGKNRVIQIGVGYRF